MLIEDRSYNTEGLDILSRGRISITRQSNNILDMEYMADLKKNKYTDCFFSGFEQCVDNEAMIWNRNLAWKAAGFDKSGDTHLSKRSKKGR